MKREKLKGFRYARLLVVLIMFSLLCTTLFASKPTKAAVVEKRLMDVTEGGSFKGSFKINDVLLEDIKEAHYGDSIVGQIEWAFPDDAEINVDDQLVYDLPDQIKFTIASGNITYGGATVVGRYNISDNKIIIRYTDDEFVSGNNRNGKLTFSGTLSGTGLSDDASTDVDIAFEGIGKYSFKVLPAVKKADVKVDKWFEDNDPENHIYDCYIKVSAVQDNTNVVLKDEMYPGMSLYGASPKFYKDSECKVAYEGEYFGFDEKEGSTKLNATIAKMSNEESIYVKYQVKVVPELYSWETVGKYFDTVNDYYKYYANGYEGRVPNRADVLSAESPNEKTAWADIHTLRYTFHKWNNEKDNKVDEGKLSWQFDINSIDKDITSGWIIDSLPANSTFVTDEDEIAISIKSGDVLSPAFDYISLEDMVDDEGRPQVKIIFKDSLLEELKENPVCIQYYTKVNKQSDDKVWYTNYAELFLNGISQGTSKNEMEYTKPDELTKVGNYDETTAPNAQYEIVINPAGLDLNPDGDDLIIKDTMGSALDLDVTSMLVNGEAVNTKNLTFNPSTHTFTLKLKDNESYVITYNAVVNLNVGEILDASNATNTCEVVGLTVKGGEKPSVINAVVYTSAASSSSDKDIVAIQVIKHDEKNVLNTLEGVSFKLEKIQLSGSEVTGKTSVKANLVTNEKGIIDVIGLDRNTVYCLTETKASEGYELDTTPIYFVFNKGASNSWPEEISGKYSLMVIDSSKAKETFYVSNKEVEEVTTTEEETTEATTTEEETTEATTTEEETTEATTTEEETTEATTTEEETTEATTTEEETTEATTTEEKTTAATTEEVTTTERVTTERVITTEDVTTEKIITTTEGTTSDTTSVVTTEATTSEEKTTSNGDKSSETTTESKTNGGTDKAAQTSDKTPIVPLIFTLFGSLLMILGLVKQKKSL